MRSYTQSNTSRPSFTGSWMVRVSTAAGAGGGYAPTGAGDHGAPVAPSRTGTDHHRWLARDNAARPTLRGRGKKYTETPGPVRASPNGVRYLVTGGAGFIGSHLVDRLV